MIWLVLFGLLKGRHSESDSKSDSESEINIKLNSAIGPVTEKKQSVDLQGSCNMVMSPKHLKSLDKDITLHQHQYNFHCHCNPTSMVTNGYLCLPFKGPRHL